MAKAGRPANEHKSRLIRVHDDIADMLAWIAELSGDPIAEFVDPLLRPEVEDRYEVIRHRVAVIKAAMAGPPVMIPDLGGES